MELTNLELKEYKGGMTNFLDILVKNILKSKSLGKRMGLGFRIYLHQKFCH